MDHASATLLGSGLGHLDGALPSFWSTLMGPNSIFEKTIPFLGGKRTITQKLILLRAPFWARAWGTLMGPTHLYRLLLQSQNQ